MSIDPTLIVYHADCADGFGAAWACHQRFGDKPRYLAAHYGSPPEVALFENERVLMVDVSFPRDALLERMAVAESFLLVDHHKTAFEQVGDLPNTVFDMNKSGATLAWRLFNPDQPLPALLQAVEDRDLWLWRLPDSKPILRCLDSQPLSFAAWSEVARRVEGDLPGIRNEAQILEREYERQLGFIIQEARPIEQNGWRGLSVNAPHSFASDIGNRFYAQDGVDFGFTWHARKDGKFRCSWRTDAQGPVRALDLASAWGGGGHPNAAGSTLDAPTFLAFMAQCEPAPPGLPAQPRKPRP